MIPAYARIFILFFFLIAAGTSQTSASQTQATPGFWIIEKDGKTLYLFGSVHLLPPEMNWKREEIEKARAASQVFVFEAPLKEAEAGMARFVERNGRLPEGKTLETILTPQLFADLEKAAWTVQYPPKLLLPLRPWLASVYLELYSYIKAGFSPFYGVDHIIEEEERARGVEFAYFETVDEQLSFFSGLTPKAEKEYLEATIRGVLNDPGLPDRLIGAWASGNVVELSKLIDKGFDEVPQLREQLLVARNKRWVPKITKMLSSSKTHFVTVGAGHLVGRDSVIAMLRARGYRVRGP